MNQGLFGILGSASATGSSKVRIRKPFSVDEQNKSGIRLSDLGSHAFGVANVISNIVVQGIAASPSIVVAVGYSNAATPTATTTAMSSVDGYTWITQTIGSGIYANVIWTGTRFLAKISASTACSISTDGAAWSAGTALPASAASYFLTHNGKLYQFPSVGTVYYEFTTLDATASTTRTSPANYLAPLAVISACGAIIETVSGGQLRYSYDGVAWNTAASPGFVPTNIAGNGSTLVALDSSGQYNVSKTAGVTWEFAIPKMFNLNGLDIYSESASAIGASGTGVTPGFGSSYTFGQNTLPPSLSLGERFCVRCQVTNTTDMNGVATAQTWDVMLHTTDGFAWTMEYPYGGKFTVGTASSNMQGISFKDRFIFGRFRSDSATTSYIYATNPDFQELIYDV